jgi:ACS family hexuronate transporter-like MFS transporter
MGESLTHVWDKPEWLTFQRIARSDSGFYWILAVISAYNYLDRTSLSALIATVGPDLHITNLIFGFAGNTFFATYTICYLFGGRLADKLGPLPVLFLSLGVWSTAEILQGFVSGAVSLCVVRALLGAGEGPFYAIAAKALSQRFSSAQRANPLALILSAGQVGAILSAPTMSAITARVGWRVSFVFVGICGLALLVFCLFALGPLTANKPIHSEISDSAASGLPTGIGRMDKLFFRLLLVRAATDATYYFYVFWMPKYFHDVQHFKQSQIGHSLWVPYLAGFMGAIASGKALSLMMTKRMDAHKGRRPLFLISGLLAMTGGVTAISLSSHLALLTLSLACFGHLAWLTLLYGAIIDAVPVERVGLLFGLSGASGTFASALSQPAIGAIIDRFGYPPIFVACSVTMLLGVIAVVTAKPAVIREAASV